MTYEHNPKFKHPREVLPHGKEIRYVDGIIDADKTRVVAFRNIPETYPRRVVDEVEHIETLAQAGAYSIFAHEKGLAPLFGAVERANFEREVLPGEQVKLDVSILDRDKKRFKGAGVASVAGDIACTSVFSGFVFNELLFERSILRRDFADGGIDMPKYNPNLVRPFSLLRDADLSDWLDYATASGWTNADGVWFPANDAYAGHRFVGQDVLPGIRQLGALRNLAYYGNQTTGPKSAQPRLKEVRGVSFFSPVRNGERLDLHVQKDPSDPDIVTYIGVASVGSTITTEATLEFRLREAA